MTVVEPLIVPAGASLDLRAQVGHGGRQVVWWHSSDYCSTSGPD